MITRKNLVIVIIVVIAMLLITCSLYSMEYTTPAITPPPVTSSVLRPTINAMEVERYAAGLRAEDAMRNAQATLTILNAQATATIAAVQDRSTAIAYNTTATAAAIHTNATAVSHHATIAAESHRATATASAQQRQIVATADSRRATATVSAINFAHRATETACAWNLGVQATVQSHQTRSTVQAAEAQRAILKYEREKMIAPVKTYGPWLFFFLIVVILAFAGLAILRTYLHAYEIQSSKIYRDENGEMPVLVINANRHLQTWDENKAINPLNPLGRDADRYALPDIETQNDATRRYQMMALSGRFDSPQNKRSEHQPPNDALPPTSSYRVLSVDETPPRALVNEDTMAMLNTKWRDE